MPHYRVSLKTNLIDGIYELHIKNSIKQRRSSLVRTPNVSSNRIHRYVFLDHPEVDIVGDACRLLKFDICPGGLRVPPFPTYASYGVHTIKSDDLDESRRALERSTSVKGVMLELYHYILLLRSSCKIKRVIHVM